jgi:hypothetical protein|tara:strand:+ start:10717 stop:11037 length:321 start_codon:yes stop_codon:yes gene_type:complete
MIKKTLFTLFLFVATIVLSQEKTIENLSTAPNPFKQNTNISFKVNTASTVTLLVKNVLGKTVFKKKIKTKVGKNTIPFFKDDLATGMYIYSIQNVEKIVAKRFVIQ